MQAKTIQPRGLNLDGNTLQENMFTVYAESAVSNKMHRALFAGGGQGGSTPA